MTLPLRGPLCAALVFGAAFVAGRLVAAPGPAQACPLCEHNGEHLELQVLSVTVDGVERPEARGYGGGGLVDSSAPDALHLGTGTVAQYSGYHGEASGRLYDPDLQAPRAVALKVTP
ncbi:MAG TPA: hypothetical protein VFO83_16010 [Aggregicoccus sp.]|nr:hypothetical protein [Aggregicoccus sp.]